MTQNALARRMFLVLHDPFSGKALGPPKLIRYAVGTAGLAELVMQRRLAVDGGRIAVAGEWRDGGADAVQAILLGAVGPAGSDITRSWVEEVGDAVYAQVVRGLVADRVIRREVRGGLLRRGAAERFPAVDLLSAAGPRVQLEHMLCSPHDMDVVGSTFATILDRLRLDAALDFDCDRGVVRRAAAAAVRGLPGDLRNLVTEVAKAVVEVTLTFRRL
ncbi:GPP34 family phosphoprotein [Pseudonocardia adelaidensis]|uniref:Golgi phosphoprotein 3 GPP34 n=1 Tax=Pseudonocardia adelaidensis TaxID=648754 RepID=A0ABP9NBR5_9PSEU